MSHVTYETAQRLKENHFPQPTGTAGQFWYGKKTAGNSDPGGLCVLIGDDIGELRFRPVSGVENENNKFFVFAPTATDILKELPQCYYLCFTKIGWQVRSIIVEKPGQNQAWAKGDVSTHWAQATHENPAECAALAWLAINEKK